MLAGLERVLDDGEVQGVGGAHVHGVQGLVVQDFTVVGLDFFGAELGAELAGLLDLGLADGVDLDEAQPANALQVNAADETGAE